MMYMVVFKCTRAERDGYDAAAAEGAQPLDCYMVANKMFETVDQAKVYANAMPLSRQARVVDVIQFRCPRSGEWMPKPGDMEPVGPGPHWSESQKEAFVEDLVDCVGHYLDIDTGTLTTGQMRQIVTRVRFWIGEYRTREGS